MTLDQVAATVADNLNRPADDPAVARAVAAAWHAVTVFEELDAATVTQPPDAFSAQGLIVFARSVLLDETTARGSQTFHADGTVEALFVAEDIYRHHRHYFGHLRHQWGVA